MTGDRRPRALRRAGRDRRPRALRHGLGQSKHTFESGTIAAAFGGTTTVIDFTLDLKTLGGPLLDAVEKRREKAEGKAVIDFAFHCVVQAPRLGRAREPLASTAIPNGGFRLSPWRTIKPPPAFQKLPSMHHSMT